MANNIKNNLNHVTIGGAYIGGDSVVNNYNTQEVSNKLDEGRNDKTVFLSYNWKDGDIANRIDTHLSGLPGITVKRDIRDIGPWKSIREFMSGIRQQDYAVLIISDSYLKSKNCMFEVLEMMKEQQYKDRIFPAVVEQGIYDPLVRSAYIRYWQQESEKLEAAIQGIGIANAVELASDLKHYMAIAASMGEFLDWVSDINNPDIKDAEVQIAQMILRS